MNDASFRTDFGETLGRHSGKAGLIVDTRFNGGGKLHDEHRGQWHYLKRQPEPFPRSPAVRGLFKR